jgi:hypothetical protein
MELNSGSRCCGCGSAAARSSRSRAQSTAAAAGSRQPAARSPVHRRSSIAHRGPRGRPGRPGLAAAIARQRRACVRAYSRPVPACLMCAVDRVISPRPSPRLARVGLRCRSRGSSIQAIQLNTRRRLQPRRPAPALCAVFRIQSCEAPIKPHHKRTFSHSVSSLSPNMAGAEPPLL